MLKKKKELDIDKIVLNVNKLIHLHDCTFVKLCNKKDDLLSITAIDSIEYKHDESLIYLERTINNMKETLTAFPENSIKDISYISDIDKVNNKEVLIVTVIV